MNIILTRFSRSFLFFLFIFLFIPARPGHSFEEKLNIGVSILEPWKIQSSTGLEGAEIDILKEIGLGIKRDPQFKVAPLKRCLERMESGDIDIMTGLLRKKEREAYIHYIEPPYKTKSNKVFYMLKGTEKNIGNYEDLRNLRIGTKIGARYFPKFDRDDSLQKIPVNSYEQNIKKLITDRLDTFIITDSHGDFLIKQMGLQDRLERAAFKYNKTNNVYIGISKKSPLMKDIAGVEEFISAMIRNGRVDEIIQSYFIENSLPIPDYH